MCEIFWENQVNNILFVNFLSKNLPIFLENKIYTLSQVPAANFLYKTYMATLNLNANLVWETSGNFLNFPIQYF